MIRKKGKRREGGIGISAGACVGSPPTLESPEASAGRSLLHTEGGTIMRLIEREDKMKVK